MKGRIGCQNDRSTGSWVPPVQRMDKVFTSPTLEPRVIARSFTGPLLRLAQVAQVAQTC